jgi:hypothetical protein
MGISQHNKALLVADMIPLIIFLRREEAAEANTFIIQVAIAQARGFCNNIPICHLLFSISSVDKSAISSTPGLQFVAFWNQTWAGSAIGILP